MFTLNPYPIRSYSKGLGDWVNLKALYNPLGNLKDASKQKNFGDMLTMGTTGLGKGIMPTVVNGYGKATISPQSGEYYYGMKEDQKAAKIKQDAANQAAWQKTEEYKAGLAKTAPKTAAERARLLNATQAQSTILGNTNATGKQLL